VTAVAERHPAPLDDPAPPHRHHFANPLPGDAFGRGAEAFARAMGTPAFLVGMTIFCAAWITWNTLMPPAFQFDPKSLNYTLLTLILSLQASYAAPLLLLAQNRQDDRDRVQAEQDRQSNERNHATTDFITREIATLRLALNDVATRDFVRGELRDLLEEAEEPERQAVLPRTPGRADVLRELVREEVRAALVAQQDPDGTRAEGGAPDTGDGDRTKEERG
jgi:uncharacterized membrane protein